MIYTCYENLRDSDIADYLLTGDEIATLYPVMGMISMLSEILCERVHVHPETDRGHIHIQLFYPGEGSTYL
jgi:hypothetical protein